MIKAEERSEVQGAAKGTAASKASAIPRCVCSWKNCRVYQKVFRGHPVWDGVIKLKFATNEPETMALKSSIDRNLKVPAAKADDWKPGKHPGQESIKYNVACHHWTEQHIRKYRADPKHFSFVKPFSVHGASKYLFKVDSKETFRDPGNETDELLYLQAPLVPKDAVKNLFYQIKEEVGDDIEEGETPHHKEDLKSSSQAQAQAHAQMNGNTPEKAPTDTKTQTVAPLSPDDRKDSVTVSTNRSKQEEACLQDKEAENKRLKEQLETMQSQLAYLHDMIQKLQLNKFDQGSARGGASTGKAAPAGVAPPAGAGGRPYNRTRRPASGPQNDSRRTGSRSSRSSVPNEIEIESEDDGGWIEPSNDWSDEEENNRGVEDDQSNGTFHVTYQAQRRNSFSSRASRTSRATSVISASKSIKSLPRELELEDDEDDDESHESLEEEAIDNRSFASSKRSRSQKGSNHKRTNMGAKKPHRRASMGDSSHRSGGRGSSDAGSVGGVYQVTALIVTDPYGEQGTYTGSISNSTGMPHGFGRLEYDKAGRWYEGDWKHGRWTGQGRLSNGDGDYYEGGLKNDHKHGRGVMRFADGRIFEGEYVNGQMVEGKMTYQDGSTYSGGWVDGMRHGRGRCVFTDNSVYEGEFKEGEFFGHGKMSWSDGGWYEGEWYNGEMQGFGKEVRPDGSLRHEGQWVKGQPIRK